MLEIEIIFRYHPTASVAIEMVGARVDPRPSVWNIFRRVIIWSRALRAIFTWYLPLSGHGRRCSSLWENKRRLKNAETGIRNQWNISLKKLNWDKFIYFAILFLANRYEIMLACWDETSESRPLFDKLEEMFSKILHTNLTKHYVNLNEIYSKAEPLRVAVSQNCLVIHVNRHRRPRKCIQIYVYWNQFKVCRTRYTDDNK